MGEPNISESEWAVMEVLWEASPQTAAAVTKALEAKTGWAKNTVRTLLTRLVQKGALNVKDDAEAAQLYSPAVKREDCVKAESQSFIERVFQGAAKPLLVHFAKNAQLSADEVRELKNLLDQSIEKHR